MRIIDRKKIRALLLYWSKVFVVALLAVLFIRSFLLESFTVSDERMETALQAGDRVLVSRMSYGIRLPISIVGVPFVFDSIFGMRSYIDWRINYCRIFASPVKRNDVVVFNDPTETDKPIDRRSLCISRCLAVPGDTVSFQALNYRVNGEEYDLSPDFLIPYKYPIQLNDTIKQIIATLNIPLRNPSADSVYCYATFNNYETYLINQSISSSSPLILNVDDSATYKFLIPRKGMSIELDAYNLSVYKDAVLSELGNKAKFMDGKIEVNGTALNSYTFNMNYYWFLSDNISQTLDSRNLGFISESDIIGKAKIIWYSADKNGTNWKRLLRKVF